MSVSRQYFPALTGLRAVAAMLVFISHAAPLRFFTSNPLPLTLDFGIGVNIFFVLSGFLIALRYGETATMQLSFWRPYLVNRLARIYPMWWLLTTVALLWRLTHLHTSTPTTELRHYLANITFLKGFSSTLQFTQIQQGWTLTVEESFYLLAPVLLVQWRRGIRPAVLFGSAALVLLATGALLTEILHGEPEGLFSDYSFLLGWTLAGRCAEFFAGAALALWVLRRGRLPEKKHSPFTWLGIVGVATGLVLAAYAKLQGLPPLLVKVGLLQLALIGPITLLLAGLLIERSSVQRLLSSRLAQVLGRASYVFYLIHMGPVHDALHNGQAAWQTAADVLADMLMLWAVSALLYYVIESPLNTWIRQRFTRIAG